VLADKSVYVHFSRLERVRGRQEGEVKEQTQTLARGKGREEKDGVIKRKKNKKSNAGKR
jgi:hypothetical protein